MTDQLRAVHDAICKKLTDDGKLVEVGWVTFRASFMPADAGEPQVAAMRKAFFVGAQHLFASILAIMDPGLEATERDLDRMTQIHRELEAFKRELLG